MRAYRSWASARCGCRSSPFIATRMAASSWPLRRNASPSRRNTRLCGSCASCAESARMSSAMAEHPGGLEILGLERPFRLRDHLGRVTRGTGAATLCRPGIHEHDHARTLETEQRLGHLEVRTSELRRQPTDGSLAVDERQDFPFRRQEVELTAASFGWRRERRHDADVGDPVFDARPLIDAARAFHQERLHRNPDGHLGRDFALGFFGEREVAFVPAHDLEDDFLDLEADLPLDLALRDHAERHEDLAEPALVPLPRPHVARALEIGFRNLAGAQQQCPERMGIAADLGGYD